MKLRGELEKNKGKISDLQGRNRELEKQIREDVYKRQGQNYIRSLLALGFQAFLIIVCVAIYAVLVLSLIHICWIRGRPPSKPP